MPESRTSGSVGARAGQAVGGRAAVSGQRNGFTQFYTRPTSRQTDEGVIAEVRKLVNLLGGVIDETLSRWHTFDKFTYFQHFTLDQLKAGIYRDVAGMQGNDRTFYVGGATDFELVNRSSSIAVPRRAAL